MNEKRFTTYVDENRDVHILFNGQDIGLFKLCDLLNDLYEENLDLIRQIQDLEEEYYEYTVIMGSDSEVDD